MEPSVWCRGLWAKMGPRESILIAMAMMRNTGAKMKSKIAETMALMARLRANRPWSPGS